MLKRLQEEFNSLNLFDYVDISRVFVSSVEDLRFFSLFDLFHYVLY